MLSVFYKNELIAQIRSSGTGNEFPWTSGVVLPLDKLKNMERFMLWSMWHIDVGVYEPYDYDFYPADEPEDPNYPRDNYKRFLLSDNWDVICNIDKLLAYAQERQLAAVPIDDVVMIPGIKENFREYWRSEYYGFDEPELRVDDMLAYRDFLWYEHWRIEDSDGKEFTSISYPLRVNPKTYGISWR